MLKNLRKSDQQFLVAYIGAYNEITEGQGPPYALYIITEYCQGGDLCSLLVNTTKYAQLGWKFRLRLALQAASAVHYLHEINFIHRDIKSENFLLDSQWNCKLTDFGLSREIADPSVPSRYPFNSQYIVDLLLVVVVIDYIFDSFCTALYCTILYC